MTAADVSPCRIDPMDALAWMASADLQEENGWPQDAAHCREVARLLGAYRGPMAARQEKASRLLRCLVLPAAYWVRVVPLAGPMALPGGFECFACRYGDLHPLEGEHAEPEEGRAVVCYMVGGKGVLVYVRPEDLPHWCE